MKKVFSLILLSVFVSSVKAQRYDVVEPMLKTQWNQGAPYNSKCPLMVTGKETQAGCVATALAQILKYWEYPATGKGTHIYKGEIGKYSTSVPASIDLSHYSPDWGNMLSKYNDGSYSHAEADAVGHLVFNTGYMLDMDWGYKSSEPTNKAFHENLNTLLSSYLDYSKKLFVLNAPWFTDENLRAIITKELSEGRPILCTASKVGGQSGHAFVLDGMNVEGKVHVNWGWGGISDDYYDLFEMKPTQEGTGSGKGTGGYVNNAMFFLNLCPATQDYSIPKRSNNYLSCITIADSIIIDRTYTNTADTIIAESFRICPSIMLSENFTGICEVRLYNSADNTIVADSITKESNHTYNFPKMADGKYYMTFYSYEDGDDVIEPLFIHKHDIDTLFIERSNGRYILNYPNIAASTNVTAEPIEGFTAYSSNMFKNFSFNITNNGKRPFSKYLIVKIKCKEKETGEAQEYKLTTEIPAIPEIYPGSTKKYDVSFSNTNGIKDETMGKFAAENTDLRIGIYPYCSDIPLWEQSLQALPGRKVPEGKKLIEASFLEKDVVTIQELKKSKLNIVVNADTVLNFLFTIKELPSSELSQTGKNFYQGDSLSIPATNALVIDNDMPAGNYTFIMADFNNEDDIYYTQTFTLVNDTPSSVVEIRRHSDSSSSKSFKVLDKDRIVIQYKGDKYNIDGKKQ